MSDWATLADHFVRFYYGVFDADRQQLADLYRDNSMLTWEGEPHRGTTDIMAKLTALPYKKIRHQIVNLDAQPGPSGYIVVLTTGSYFVDDDQSKAIGFVQTFTLAQENSLHYIYNDVFRLV